MKELYLRTCEFNNSVLLQETLKLAISKGAKIVSSWQDEIKPIKIYNRGICNEILQIEKFFESGKPIDTCEWDRLEKKLDILKQVKFKEYTTIHNNTYINFELNGYIYYLQYSNNPFMNENYFHKEKHKNLKTKYTCYMNNLDIYSLFNYDCYEIYTLKELQDLANNLLTVMLKQKESEIVFIEKKVNNTYNDGFHYETVKEKKEIQYHVIEV